MWFDNPLGPKNNHPEWLCQWPECKYISSAMCKRGIDGIWYYLCKTHRESFHDASSSLIQKTVFQAKRRS